MVEASQHFVDLNSLQRECGKRIAQLCRCPPGYSAFISTGASAGLAVVTAACMAGMFRFRSQSMVSLRHVDIAQYTAL